MNFAVPFSVSDILERVIPGSLFLACVLFAFFDAVKLEGFDSASLPTLFLFLGLSYAVGVLANTLSGLLPIAGFRSYWQDPAPPRQRAIRDAIRQHYGVEAEDGSWSLCYGTVIRQGYAANVQVFLGLEVFCSAMSVACLGSAMVLAIKAVWLLVAGPPDLFAARIGGVAAALLPAALAFRLGARRYSRAFVASIYEGFYAWHRDGAAAPRARTDAP